MMRRKFISHLGAAIVAWPLTGRAQEVPVAGFLSSESAASYESRLRAFHQGLQESGFVEGRNVRIEYRWAEGRYDRLAEMALDLVARRVGVIVAVSTPAAQAAKAATKTIPIVFATAADAVELGLVASLNRPGGNITGVTNLNVEVAPKRLELLHELVPKSTTLAVLVNPNGPNAQLHSRNLQLPARKLGIELHFLRASDDRDLDLAFSALVETRSGGLVIAPDPFFNTRIEQLAALTLRHRVPAVYQWRAFAAAGGLVSYGSSTAAWPRLAGFYTGRVLKGEKPAELPVQQSTEVELMINLSTAKALGLAVPTSLLARAAEVIE